MTTPQKKKKLIEEAEKLTDADFIDYLLRIIEGEKTPDVSKKIPLTELEKKAIEKAETDIKEGKILSHEKADEQISSWL